MQPTTHTTSARSGLHLIVEYSVVDFIQFNLLKRSYHVTAFHLTDVFVLGLGQALGLAVTEDLVELLLTSITSAVNACCFAEPVNGSLDACGGGDFLYRIAKTFTPLWLPSTLGSFRCSRFGFVLLHFLGY